MSHTWPAPRMPLNLTGDYRVLAPDSANDFPRRQACGSFARDGMHGG